MNKRTPPFFCLPSKAPDKVIHHKTSQNCRSVGIPIIKSLRA